MITLTCLRCGRSWESRGAPGSMIRCPDCHHAKRVPAARTQAARAAAAAAWPESPANGGREKTGEDCPECGSPLYWTAARTGQTCDNEHFIMPPESAARAAEFGTKPERESAETAIAVTEPEDLSGNALFLVDRIALVRACETAAAQFSTADIMELTRSPFWNETGAQRYRDLFTVMGGLSAKVTTRQAMHDRTEQLRNGYNSPAAQLVISQIQQARAQLEYREQTLENGPAPALPAAQILASTYGNDGETDDTEYEDGEEYDDSEYISGAGFDSAGIPWNLVFILLAGGLACYGLFVWLPAKLDDRREHKCTYSRKLRPCERAGRIFTGSLDGSNPYQNAPVIRACPAHETKARDDITAHASMTIPPGYNLYCIAEEI